jgi:hypothetical protein
LKNSDKVSNLVVAVRGSKKDDGKSKRKKRHKSLNEKSFPPLKSGYLTSWLYPKIQSAKRTEGYSIPRRKRKKNVRKKVLILIFLALNKQGAQMLLR